jgi:hypothetical protein
MDRLFARLTRLAGVSSLLSQKRLNLLSLTSAVIRLPRARLLYHRLTLSSLNMSSFFVGLVRKPLTRSDAFSDRRNAARSSVGTPEDSVD